MKATLFSLSLCLLACSPAKSLTEVKLMEGCPKNSECSIELLPNKSLDISTDASGAIGYDFAEDTGRVVIHFKYSRKVKGDIQDAGYREEILLELSGNGQKREMHSDLQNAKLLFGRFCFCKGQTGYYKVDRGRITKNGKILRLQFSTPEVPQIVKEITFSLQ